MAWYRAGGGGIPSSLKTGMNAVFNKKFGTSGQNYPPNGWPDDVNLMGPLPEGTASGSIVTFPDGADDVPTKSLVVTIPPTLSGVSSVTETQTGRNLLNDSERGYASGNIYFGHSSGMAYDLSVRLKAGTYTFSVVTADGTSSNLYIQNSDTNTYISGFPAYGVLSKTFTLDEDTNLAVWVYKNGYTAVTDITSAQIEVGSTSTAYEPYTAPTTYTASLGRTIYGGTADIVTGEGEAQYDITALDDKLYNYISGITRFNVAITGIDTSGYKDNIVIPTGYTINHMLITNASAAPDMTMCVYNGSLYVKNLSCSSRAELQSALSGKNLVYPLATPTDFTFTPITPTPETALGVNNFWADEGDTTVVYRRDIDLALQAGSSSRGLMMASRPVTQLIGEQADLNQVNELVENDEIEQN